MPRDIRKQRAPRSSVGAEEATRIATINFVLKEIPQFLRKKTRIKRHELVVHSLVRATELQELLPSTVYYES